MCRSARPRDHGHVWIVITSVPTSADEGCLAPVVARAALTWTIEPLRASLAPADRGPYDGASGTTEVIGDRIVSYAVASNDNLDSVATRFGLAQDDIFYLNPAREHGQDSTLYLGEVLNLDPHRR